MDKVPFQLISKDFKVIFATEDGTVSAILVSESQNSAATWWYLEHREDRVYLFRSALTGQYLCSQENLSPVPHKTSFPVCLGEPRENAFWYILSVGGTILVQSVLESVALHICQKTGKVAAKKIPPHLEITDISPFYIRPSPGIIVELVSTQDNYRLCVQEKRKKARVICASPEILKTVENEIPDKTQDEEKVEEISNHVLFETVPGKVNIPFKTEYCFTCFKALRTPLYIYSTSKGVEAQEHNKDAGRPPRRMSFRVELHPELKIALRMNNGDYLARDKDGFRINAKKREDRVDDRELWYLRKVIA